jgi:hypothetical protein
MLATKYGGQNMMNSVKDNIQQSQSVNSLNQQQGPVQMQNPTQGQGQNVQSPQNQYQQGIQSQNDANFKKNRTSSQTPPTQSSSNTINPQPGTTSGYVPGGSNQNIQQPIQSQTSTSSQNISQNQGSKIS